MKRQKQLKYYLIIIFLLLIFILLFKDSNKFAKYSIIETLEQITNPSSDDTLILIAGVGDIMMGTTYPRNVLPPDDGKYLFDGVKEYLEDADVTFGNLEGPFLNNGGNMKRGKDSSATNIVCFRMPERYASYLKAAGFDFVSLANNHNGDMGPEGRERTVETLDHYGIGYAGQIEHPQFIFIKDGISFGFAAFAPNSGTCDINDIKRATQIVSALNKECDIVIVSFHGGGEGTGAQHVLRETEYYLGEKRGNVYEFSHAMVDAGADVIFGQGPHVTRAVELYKERLICYSLGNFCTYAMFGLIGELGIAPIMRVFINNKGEFVKGRIIPIKQVKKGFPVIDEDNNIISTIRRLTAIDFPNSPLVIDDKGKITTTVK